MMHPTTATVTCAGTPHRLAWDEAGLHALDHDDPEGERALTALGGDTCTCVELLDLWAAHRHDLRVLTLASRGPGDVIARERDIGSTGWFAGGTVTKRRSVLRAMKLPLKTASPGRQLTTWAHSGTGPAIVARPTGYDDDGLIKLLDLEGDLFNRLAYTVARHAADRWSSGTVTASETAALATAVISRAETLFTGWQPRTSLDVRLAPPAAVSHATPGDSTWTLDLTINWLTDVWFTGLGVTAGYFVLDAVTEADGQLILTCVDSQGKPAKLTISHNDA